MSIDTVLVYKTRFLSDQTNTIFHLSVLGWLLLPLAKGPCSYYLNISVGLTTKSDPQISLVVDGGGGGGGGGGKLLCVLKRFTQLATGDNSIQIL